MRDRLLLGARKPRGDRRPRVGYGQRRPVHAHPLRQTAVILGNDSIDIFGMHLKLSPMMCGALVMKLS